MLLSSIWHKAYSSDEKMKMKTCFTLKPLIWRIISVGIDEGGKVGYYRQTICKSLYFSDELHYSGDELFNTFSTVNTSNVAPLGVNNSGDVVVLRGAVPSFRVTGVVTTRVLPVQR